MAAAAFGRPVVLAASADTLNKVQSIIAEQLGTDTGAVGAEKKFADLGADSLDTVEIMMALEEQFDISIDEEGELQLPPPPPPPGPQLPPLPLPPHPLPRPSSHASRSPLAAPRQAGREAARRRVLDLRGARRRSVQPPAPTPPAAAPRKPRVGGL